MDFCPGPHTVPSGRGPPSCESLAQVSPRHGHVATALNKIGVQEERQKELPDREGLGKHSEIRLGDADPRDVFIQNHSHCH